MRALVFFVLTGCGASVTRTASVNRVAYPSGAPRFEFELRHGLPNGHGKAWHPNGQVASEGNYRDGARHGRFVLYDESGTFAAQAIYIDNEEVWRSTSQSEQPPEQWTTRLAIATPEPADEAVDAVHLGPRPYFSILDRTTSLARAGAQVGVSNAGNLSFGATKRLDVFGHYRFDRYGVYAQLSETRLALDDDMTLAGRLTTTVSGTYHRALGPAMFSASAGFIAPLSNADPAGSVASYAGAMQRPTDAAFAIPAPFAVRSGASVTASRGLFVAQADAGLDWLLGSDERAVNAVVRANVGLGYGTRSTMLCVEFDNSVQLAGSRGWMRALALGGTLSYPAIWISASLVFSDGETTAFLGTVGRDL